MLLLLFVSVLGFGTALLPFEALLGRSRSFMQIVELPTARAQAMLEAYDSSLCLAPQSITSPGTHPLVLMMNYMQHLHTIPIQVT
jgi:hypothetical protein